MRTTNWEKLAIARPMNRTAGTVTSAGEDWSHADAILRPPWTNRPTFIDTRRPLDKTRPKPSDK